jgi:RNA polymerase sigma-70 factor, ECF subfamily
MGKYMDPVVSTSAEPVAEEAFEPFFIRTYPTLARALYLLTGNPADAEDVAQEAMARVWERWRRVRAMDSPEGYVYRVALNLFRRKARFARPRWLLSLPAPPPSPAALAEDHSEVVRLLRSLPLPQREVLVLAEGLGWTTREIAERCGVRESSIRVRLHRAKAALRGREDDT